jgi:hypothetical protein
MLKPIISHFPSTIPELRDFLIIGKEKLRAHQARIRAITKLRLARDIRLQALEDAQEMAAALLYAEARLGELIRAIRPIIKSSGSVKPFV